MGARPQYLVQRVDEPVCVDGRLDKRPWSLAPWMTLQRVLAEAGEEPVLRAGTRAAALWDRENLYLAFAVADQEVWSTFTHHDDRLFQEECVEFFLDPDRDGRQYIEAQINSLGTVRDLLVDPSIGQPTRAQYDIMAQWHFQSMRHAVLLKPGFGWTLEIAIPWAEFRFCARPLPPSPGEELHANFCRYERSRTGRHPLELSAWSRVRHSFHEPEQFGRLIFV